MVDGVHGEHGTLARKAVEMDSKHEDDIATILLPQMVEMNVLEKRRKPHIVTINRVGVCILYLIDLLKGNIFISYNNGICKKPMDFLNNEISACDCTDTFFGCKIDIAPPPGYKCTCTLSWPARCYGANWKCNYIHDSGCDGCSSKRCCRGNCYGHD